MVIIKVSGNINTNDQIKDYKDIYDMQTKVAKISFNKIKKNNNSYILKLINNKSINFQEFGELYISSVNYKEIRGWKYHKKMISNIFILSGKFKFVFFIEDRNYFKEIRIDEKENNNLYIPPKVWFAFQGLSNGMNSLLNLSNIIHSDDEVINKDINTLSYEW